MFWFCLRFTGREVAAVKDWLNSSLPFHAMRDNPAHGTAILGGVWGARWPIMGDNPAHDSAILGRMWGARWAIFSFRRLWYWTYVGHVYCILVYTECIVYCRSRWPFIEKFLLSALHNAHAYWKDFEKKIFWQFHVAPNCCRTSIKITHLNVAY